MIIKGTTLEKVTLAAKEICPSAKVFLKENPAYLGTLKGYISVSGSPNAYRTKPATVGSVLLHPWQPCFHFYKHLLHKLGYGVTLVLHKHHLKYTDANTKGKLALGKKGLVCGHSVGDPSGSLVISPLVLTSVPPISDIAVAPAPVLPPGIPLSFPLLDGAPMEPGQTNSIMTVRGKQRPIYAVTTSLYLLEYCKVGASRIPATTSSEIPDHLLMRASHAVQWRNRVTRYAEHFANTFARNLFDYLTVASFGEARHGQGSKFTFDVSGMKGGRNTAYQCALAYDPRDLLPKLEYVYNHCAWGGSYGGKKWGKIAKFAGEFFKPMYRNHPIVFADHVVDLAHNGGLAFNKGYIIANPDHESNFMAMLDSKRNDTFMKTDIQHPITPLVYELYMTGVSLGIVERSKAGFTIKPDVEVPTLSWGDKHIALYPGQHITTEDSTPSTDDTDTSPMYTGVPVETYPSR